MRATSDMEIYATVTTTNGEPIVYIVLDRKRFDRFNSGELFNVHDDGCIAFYGNAVEAAQALDPLR